MVRDKRTGKITACKMFDLGENDEHIQEVYCYFYSQLVSRRVV